MEKSCMNCHWNWNDVGAFQACLPLIGVCIDKSKWTPRETPLVFAVEGEPTFRYDIHVSGLSTVGQELKAELPKIGEE